MTRCLFVSLLANALSFPFSPSLSLSLPPFTFLSLSFPFSLPFPFLSLSLALSRYRKTIALQPKNALALSNAANLLNHAGHHSEARIQSIFVAGILFLTFLKLIVKLLSFRIGCLLIPLYFVLKATVPPVESFDVKKESNPGLVFKKTDTTSRVTLVYGF